MEEGDVNEEHLAHVDASKPGILAEVTHVVGVRKVLIEGHHRAYRALVLGEDFTALRLTAAETEQVITHRRVPPGMRRR